MTAAVTKQMRLQDIIVSVIVVLSIGVTSLGQAQGWEVRVCAEPNSLPYSNKQQEGFENRIAEIIAEELEARLSYIWLPQPHTRARDLFIQEGRCDLVMGIPDGHTGFLTSLAYYRTTYVFVYRDGEPYEIDSFDDPDLADLQIGIQISGGSMSPTSYALAKRGLVQNQLSFGPTFDQPDPLAGIIEAVSKRKVDVAVAWGPVAGYFARKQPGTLKLVPVQPQIDTPFIPMVASISMGVRISDEALRNELDVALARRWTDIQTVLREYGVPLEPLTAPTLTNGAP